MINTDIVLTQARSNQAPPTWQVYRGRPSFYARQIVLGGFLLAVAAAGAIYLISHPFIAVTAGYAGDNLDPQTFHFTRGADFVLLGLFAITGIGAMIRYLFELSKAYQQVLVLLPEGFALGTSQTVAYAYGTIREMRLIHARGRSSLDIYAWNAQKPVRVRFDGRFGNSRQLVGAIYAMWKNYTTVGWAMQLPSRY